MKFNDKYKIRTRQLAIRTLHWSASLPEFKHKPTGLGVVEKQLLRSVTSVAANFRAFCRGRSEKECFAKLCIVVEGNDEALF